MEKNKIRETVEDASKKNALLELENYQPNKEYFKLCLKNAFIRGARWQGENMPVHILDVDTINAYIKDGMVVIEKK